MKLKTFIENNAIYIYFAIIIIGIISIAVLYHYVGSPNLSWWYFE